jgi:hypothetical protein
VDLLRAYRAATLTDLHEQLCRILVESPRDKLDVVSAVDVQIHDTISEAASMQWEFDLKSMWLTPQRWTMMQRQYIDPVELRLWIERITSKIGLRDRGIAHMRTKTVAARGGAATGHTNKETRRWGSCMLGLSFKAVPTPTLLMHSRTSYLGYLAALDLSVAWMCGRYLARELGCSVSDFKFVWMNEALQYHNFKSLAFLLNHRDPEMRKHYRRLILLSASKLSSSELEIVETSPGLRLSRVWMMRMRKLDAEGKSYGDMTYNTYRRIRRRYHTEVRGLEYAQRFEGWSYYKKGEKEGEQKEFFKAYGELPSTPIETLDFKGIGMPWGQDYGEAYTGGGEDDEDDDE